MSPLMQLYALERRQRPSPTTIALTATTMPVVSTQQPPPPGGIADTQNQGDTTLPSYIWILVVIFIFVAVTFGFCARRRHRNQLLSRRALFSSQQQRDPYMTNASRYAPPWAGFSPTNVHGSDPLRPPPRARTRPDSVTSLPLYMENPGAQEVVLLQRTGPKEVERPPTSNQSAVAVPIHEPNAPSEPQPDPAPRSSDINSGLPSYQPPPPPSSENRQ